MSQEKQYIEITGWKGNSPMWYATEIWNRFEIIQDLVTYYHVRYMGCRHVVSKSDCKLVSSLEVPAPSQEEK